MWKKFNDWFENIKRPLPESAQRFHQKIGIKNFEFDLMPAQEADLADIIALQENAYQGETQWPLEVFTEELQRTNDRLYVVLRQPETGSLVALIGCAFRMGIHEVHITNIMVAPHWQNRGIGTFLVMYMMTIAQQLDFHRMSLEVRVSNVSAKKLYERLGFQVVRRKTHYYGEDGEDAFDMAQLLGEYINHELLN
ncbi:ribosomal protein S18-alanine N-acetyltransferase [Weissella bombi]|uniref:Ribosomal-protein-alanine N-acetyltransferase n=1 Tax=Weissella bombi TaxID=1505725 RepID=A0A1C4B367_9LACO|nr:ribosomal protein S18-alanine N-acetyltransferase [Weissella bombi]SCC01162.1 ribosomal-protein-alanine N-acetyltransferase [Weissella bombi]